jgi:predicted permease
VAVLKRLRRWLFGRRSFERDMAEEIRFHVERRAQDLARKGIPEAEAKRRAQLEFGGMESWKEECREAGGYRPLDELRADLRYGIRTLARSPSFALAAILSLAIGIGVNTAIFSLIDAVWMRPMAVPDEGRVTRLFTTSPQESQDWFSWPEYLEFSRQSRSFSGVVAVGGRGARMRRADGTFELLTINAVSENFFSTLGVKAAVGRLFTPEDGHALTERPVVALGYRFWQRHYGGDPSIAGRQIRLEGQGNQQLLLTVCGILPAAFGGINPSDDRDIWMPPQTFAALRGAGDFENRGFRWFSLLGRIRSGTPVHTASAELATIASRLAASWPETNRGRSARAVSDLAYRMDQARGPATIFLGVVLLVLIMSAVNVANLLMARAAARSQELSIRAAIGARRGRIVRQMLTESVLLGGGGLLAGVAVGWVFIRALPSMVGGVPGYRIDLFHAGLDIRVFAFATALALATTIFFGFVPAIGAARTDLNALLRRGDGRRPGRRLNARQVFIGAQAALSLTLLALAAVLIDSFVHTRTADLGIARREQLLLWCGSADPKQVREAASRLHALPGVEDVALAVRAPLATDEGGMAVRVSFPERPEIDKAAPLEIKYNAIDSNFLRVMGTPVVRGRGFDEADQTGSAPPTVLISQTMASRYWPGRDPVGATIRIGASPGKEHRIIGVVKDVPFNHIDQQPEPYLYLPWYRNDYGEVTFVVHTHPLAETLADTGRRTLIAIDRRLDPFSITTEADLIRFSALQYQLTAELLSMLGLIGLVLTAIGLYGVVAWSVTRRTREIGIRMALGASRMETLSLVLRQTAIVGGAGILAGLPLALAATRAAAALLYGTNPWDAGMLAIATAVLAVVLLAAGLIPARRATRIDPMSALRTE